MDASEALSAALTERQWQRRVEDAARLAGWLAYHTFDSRRSVAGFPDLVLVKGQRVIYAELKRAKGRLMPAQMVWRDALIVAGEEWYLWRPADWCEVCRVLGVEAV